ncbi:hypothetical protein V493_02361 [Pseudogymnoascus sp. VKM F-4281 (FW-2241)]|nr:hypothetical protein V493_02361 [Pseudogymnoascus sp. VKM F-4281 (FW-2241)]
MANNDRREAIQVTTYVTIIMAFVFVALRMISRIFITRNTSWDDYMMVVAWAIAFGGALDVLLAAQKGFGLLDADLSPEWIPPLRKYGPYGHQDEHPPVLPTPFEDEEAVPDWHKCIPVVIIFLASSPANVFTDVAILVLPIPLLTGIHLPRRQKAVLVLTFGLGIFVTVVDVIRIYYLEQALEITTADTSTPQVSPGLGASYNFVFNVSYGLMWSIVEVNIGIVCGCIPLLKPLMVKIAPKLINAPGLQNTHTSPVIPAAQIMPGQLSAIRHRAAANNIEGFTPLDFRMPANPLPETSMTPAPNLGTPVLENSHRTSVSSIGGLGETSAQSPSPRVSLSTVQEGGSSLYQPSQGPSLPPSQEPSQGPSLQPSQEPSASSAMEGSTPIEQTESSTSLSTEPGNYSPRRRLPQQITPSYQHGAEDSVQHTAQPAQEELLSPQQQQEQEMDSLDFLTSPRTANHPGSGSAPDRPNKIHFGFVKIRQPKSMLRTSAKDSWKYCAWVSVSFFLLGFSYGLLNTLNVQIALIAHYTQSLTVSLHTIYFGAYLFGPLTVGLYCLKKGGFKVTIMVGLCIFGTGTLIFWPSSILLAYPGFIVSNFIMGFGLSVFETAANPFVILCGPPRYGEFRILVVQFVQSVGAIFSQLLVERAFFPPDEEHNNVLSIRWTYLVISFITVILALIFHYMPLPEASDEDLQNSLQTRLLPLNHTINDDSGNRIFGFRVIYVSLAFACFTMWCYVFTQESFNVWFNNSLLSGHTGLDVHRRRLLSPIFSTIGHSVFSGSLLLSAALCLYLRPRFVLFGAHMGTCGIRLAFTLVPREVDRGDSTVVAGLAVAHYFCAAPVYAIIFGLALRGLGSKTKLGSALVTTMNVGGAAGPWIVLLIIRHMGPLPRPFIAGVILLFLSTMYPIYLSLTPKAREIVDWNDDGDGESERRRSRSDSITAVEAANSGVYNNGRGLHWPSIVEKEFEHIRRASATSSKALSKWGVSVRDWTRRVSGLGKEAAGREFA